MSMLQHAATFEEGEEPAPQDPARTTHGDIHRGYSAQSYGGTDDARTRLELGLSSPMHSTRTRNEHVSERVDHLLDDTFTGGVIWRKISERSSVYAALLFFPALSRLKTGTENTRIARLAFLLCLLNALIQTGVVWAINIYATEDFLVEQHSVIHSDQMHATHHHWLMRMWSKNHHLHQKIQTLDHKAFLPAKERGDLEDAMATPPLCRKQIDGGIDCAPYGLRYVTEWSALDTDGDGVWTWEEAVADKKNLGDNGTVPSPKRVFHHLVRSLQLTADHLEGPHYHGSKKLYLSKSIKDETAIPKAYFDFWRGDAMMCAQFDANSCEAAAQSGVFDAALKPGRVSADYKGISSLDTAVEYCLRMLSEGGGCDIGLPTEFKTNREQRWGMCGDSQLVDAGTFVNPYDAKQKIHVVRPEYAEVLTYERITSPLYIIFTIFLLALWYLSFLPDIDEMLLYVEFFINFPGIAYNEMTGLREKNGFEIKGSDTDMPGYKFTGISKRHRSLLGFIFVVRLYVTIRLLTFGRRLLVEESDYLELVMNSLALAFVLQTDSMLFTLVEKDMAKALECCKPMRFEPVFSTFGWCGYVLKKEFWGMVLVPVIALYVTLAQHYLVREPFLELLRCACSQVGEHCLDSLDRQKPWWDHYWSKTLPAAMHQIEALRIAGV